jgi:hypothetical protein
VLGAVIAAVFLERVPRLVTDVAHLDGSATNFFYGSLLVLLMFLMPGGAVGLIARLRGRSARRRLATPKEPADVVPAVSPAVTGRTSTPTVAPTPTSVPASAVPEPASGSDREPDPSRVTSGAP